MKTIYFISVLILLGFTFGCTTTVFIASARCDVAQGTNTIDKVFEGGGSVDAKAALK
jgi:hypothetical protein